MVRHPYEAAPDHQIWRREPGISDHRLFDPVVHPKFRISLDDAVVTAGSCFAQHVARHLVKQGFNFLVTETPSSVIDSDTALANHYGLFSARYGNIYTARQLRQLLDRAYGRFTPETSAWMTPTGFLVDPYRPQIQQGGYLSEKEIDLDRDLHFVAVRKAFEEMDVFVFTLGLTECWEDSRDGAVFPLAPGVVAGVYDTEIHRFRNFRVEEVVADIEYCIGIILSRNPDCRFIFTVSPVALSATAIDRHVFVSTVYSKAVLRIAAEQLTNGYDNRDYFPSYEIIVSPYSRGQYYSHDCRDVTEVGVKHVMGIFLKHYGDGGTRAEGKSANRPEPSVETLEIEHAINMLCDEAMISNERTGLDTAPI